MVDLERPLEELRLIQFVPNMTKEELSHAAEVLKSGALERLNFAALEHTILGVSNREPEMKFRKSVCRKGEPYAPRAGSPWRYTPYVYDHASAEAGTVARRVPESTWRIPFPSREIRSGVIRIFWSDSEDFAGALGREAGGSAWAARASQFGSNRMYEQSGYTDIVLQGQMRCFDLSDIATSVSSRREARRLEGRDRDEWRSMSSIEVSGPKQGTPLNATPKN